MIFATNYHMICMRGSIWTRIQNDTTRWLFLCKCIWTFNLHVISYADELSRFLRIPCHPVTTKRRAAIIHTESDTYLDSRRISSVVTFSALDWTAASYSSCWSPNRRTRFNAAYSLWIAVCMVESNSSRVFPRDQGMSTVHKNDLINLVRLLVVVYVLLIVVSITTSFVNNGTSFRLSGTYSFWLKRTSRERAA